MDVFRSLDQELIDAEKEDLNLTSSSGCDMSDSFENSMELLSPNDIVPRKLNFNNNSPEYTGNMNSGPFSPPYKRVRALRLFDSPATPKTIIEKSQFTTPAPRSRLFQHSNDKPRAVPSAYSKNDRPAANVNPFTPNGNHQPPRYLSLFNLIYILGMLLQSKKRSRSKRSLLGSPSFIVPKFQLNDSDFSDDEVEQPTKRVALQVSQNITPSPPNSNHVIFRKVTSLVTIKNSMNSN